VKDSHIRTRYGKFDPLKPRKNEVDIRDIAFGLAGEYRFSGHSRLTVAQHSVVGSYYCEEPLAFLLHDASEALGLRDIATPLKHTPKFKFYRDLENATLAVVYEALDIPALWNCDAVKATDRAMYVTESFRLWNRPVETGETFLPLTTKEYRIWPPDEAEQRFLARYSELTGDRSVELVGAITQGPHTIAGLPVIDDPDATHTNFLVNSKTAAVVAATKLGVTSRPPCSFTHAEYAKENNVSRATATYQIAKLRERGIVKPVRFSVVRSDGQRQTVGGWQLTTPNAIDSNAKTR